MIPALSPMILLLAKATLILVAALGITIAMQRGSAGARHLVWLSTLAIVLLVPAVTAWVPQLPVKILPPVAQKQSAQAAAPSAAQPVTQPAIEQSASTAPVVTAPTSIATEESGFFSNLSGFQIALLVWAAIALALAGWLTYGALVVRRIVRNAHPLDTNDWLTPLYEVADRLELEEPPRLLGSNEAKMPFACGFIKPTIVFPADCDTWSPDRRRAVLLHELAHVKRHDLVGHTLGRLACAIYWFHPLVWMARRRMVLEAERACDDAVLSRFESASYAEQLVKLAQRLSTRQPVPAMANRRDLRARIDAVLDAAQARGPARAASTTLILVAAVSLAVGLAPLRTVARAYTVNEITRDVVLEASHPVAVPDPTERRTVVDAPVVRPVAGSARDRIVRAQGQAGAVDRPRFAEATITPCAGANGGRSGGPGSPEPPSAGGLGMGCRSVADMIRRSHGYGEHSGVPVEGGPSWIESERYQITARAEGNPGMSVMMGPMLQTLLEDRFKLRLRRDTRNVSGYALVVADGGHKLAEAVCEPPRQPPVAFLPPPDRPCAWSLVITVRGSNGSVGGKWVSPVEFAGALRDLLGRPVVDKTEIPWRFDARLEFAPEGTMVQTAIGDIRFVKNPNLGPATAPVIFRAIEGELGLRLDPATVPTDVFVVEHVEQP